MNILELRLFTNELSKQKEFYSNILGLEISSEENSSFKIKIGASKLTFIENNSIDNPYYHYAINIPENQINEAINWLGSKVKLIEYENSPLVNFPNWNAHSVYYYDACGNIVELIARHNLNNKSDKEFSVKSFLNISEVGMPVENVKDFYNVLNEKLGEKLWWGNFETFAAIGDEEGLFIVVTSRRNWFPTDKPCKVFPLAVKIAVKSSLSLPLKYSEYLITSNISP